MPGLASVEVISLGGENSLKFDGMIDLLGPIKPWRVKDTARRHAAMSMQMEIGSRRNIPAGKIIMLYHRIGVKKPVAHLHAIQQTKALQIK